MITTISMALGRDLRQGRARTSSENAGTILCGFRACAPLSKHNHRVGSLCGCAGTVIGGLR